MSGGLTHKFAVTLVSVALLAVAAFMGAGAASAHATLIASDPAENAELAQAPTQVTATFNEPMQAQFAAMTVVGPDGDLWSTGDPQVRDVTITVGVRPLGPAGTYTVNYRATSADGHVVSGSWSFRLTTAGTTAAAPTTSQSPAPTTPAAAAAPAQTPPEAGMPMWPFWLGAIAAVGAAAWWAARRRT